MAVSYPIDLAFLGLGGLEWLVVLIVGLLVIGPKDLPPLVRGAVALWRKIQLMAHEFQTMFEDMANEMDAKKHAEKIKNELMAATGVDEINRKMQGDIKKLTEVEVIAPVIKPKKKKTASKTAPKTTGKRKEPKAITHPKN